jgi:hypothetical protein
MRRNVQSLPAIHNEIEPCLAFRIKPFHGDGQEFELMEGKSHVGRFVGLDVLLLFLGRLVLVLRLKLVEGRLLSASAIDRLGDEISHAVAGDIGHRLKASERRLTEFAPEHKLPLLPAWRPLSVRQWAG